MATLYDQIYRRCPVAIQNLGISAYGYYWKWQRFGREFERSCAGFSERDRWPPGRMQSYLEARLRQVLHSAATSAYYREKWRAAGISAAQLAEITPDTLHRLPILPKDDVRLSPLAFLPESARRSGRKYSFFTSGSTGTPLRAICSRGAHQRFMAAREVRSFGWAGTSLRRPRAMIGGRLIVPDGRADPPFYRYNIAERQVYLSAYHIAPAHVSDYVRGLNRYRPDVITGYAFSQATLARMMHQQGLALEYVPRAAITSSEKLTAEMRAIIFNAWGCRAYQEYGSVENCCLATECEFGGLHVSPDFGILEIVDDDGYPVPAGVEGRVLCTGLLNDTQLLIRYDIGDLAAWSKDTCPCGRDHLPLLQELSGRVEDAVVGSDGRELVRFHGVFVNLPHVMMGQVVQISKTEYLVRVVAESGFGEAEIQEIRRRFSERLGDVKVHVETSSDLERTANGKVKAVINRCFEKAKP